MKKTSAEQMYDYYKRNPGASIPLNDLHIYMKNEGCTLTRIALRGGARILIEDGYLEKDDSIPYTPNVGCSYRLKKLGYVARIKKVAENITPTVKNAKLREAGKEAKAQADSELKHTLRGAWS